MWTGLLKQKVPQTEIYGVGNDDHAASYRALGGLKTLEVCLLELHTALGQLETKVNVPCLLAQSLSPSTSFPLLPSLPHYPDFNLLGAR